MRPRYISDVEIRDMFNRSDRWAKAERAWPRPRFIDYVARAVIVLSLAAGFFIGLFALALVLGGFSG